MVVVIPTQVSLCGVCILPQAIMCYFHRVWLPLWLPLTVEIQFSSFGVLVIVNCKKVCVCVLSLPAMSEVSSGASSSWEPDLWTRGIGSSRD